MYQIYPRSFADGSGDGVGDLDGLRARLEYLQWLGRRRDLAVADLPLADGRLRLRRQRLLRHRPAVRRSRRRSTRSSTTPTRAASACSSTGCPTTPPTSTRGSSSSRSSRDDPSALVPGATPAERRRPAQQLARRFGDEPAWTCDEATEQWYLHRFLPQQPDLNWDDPEVVAAMHDVLRFWLDRGVDGFRIDVVH